MKTHWKKLNNPNYLGAYSLAIDSDGDEIKYNSIVATIDKVREETVKNERGSEQCRVAHLKGLKPMILNTVNSKAIEKATGSPFIEDWSGKRITIYVAKIKAFGEHVDALRIKSEAPIQLKKLINNSDDWNNVLTGLKQGFTIEQVRKKFIVSPEQEKELCNSLK